LYQLKNFFSMDKKSKVLLWALALLIVASVGVTYWRIMIKKDYVVEAQVDCDPYENECFVWECDPESTVEGEACTGDSEADTWYFAVAKRNAGKIPLCDSETDENCDPWTCEEGEKDCEAVFCEESIMEEQYASACIDPVQFAIDNPVEEEAVECEDGDEECLALQTSEEIVCEEGDEECAAAAEEETVCDLELDPTCEDNASSADESDSAGEDENTISEEVSVTAVEE
jgi:hypothetical protein